ncbi:MAG: S9 family peptidase [marine benthic group bacterium]|nr:S9 family peptidase [Gemmatimonadota bacterium]
MVSFVSARQVALTLVAAVVVLAPQPAPAQTQDVLTEHRVADIQYVGQIAASPDGGQVAYTVIVPREPFVDADGPAWSHLYLLDVATGESRLFVGGEVNISGLRFSPDGGSVLYLSRREGDRNRVLYSIPVGGGESTRLLEHSTSIGSYSLSPTGDRVAFLATDPEPEARKKLREEGFKAVAYEEDVPFSRVWIAQRRSGDEVFAGARRLELDGNASSLSWSPAGDRIAVALAPTPLIDDSYMHRRLHVVDPTSGTVAARIQNPGKLGATAWSPDGSYLAFISGETINDPKEGRLMVADAETGEFRDVIPGFEGHFTLPAWTDARTIRYLADVGSETEIGQVRVDGSNRSVVVGPGDAVFTSFAVSDDGEVMALAGERYSHPTELFVQVGGSDAPERVTDSNPWLADMRLAPQEVIRWSARDGLELEGILIRPLAEVSDRTYPLIVHVHGGPEAHNRNGWLTSYSRPGQVAAARGIAVLYPNYRASTGRGVEFSMLDHADMGGREFDDVVDGVDHLIAAGLVDSARVGVTGGSYGGYATAWLSTYYSDRFAVGAMSVGISNQISKVGTSDIPDEMYLVHNRLRPWDDWELFLERSPVYWADRSTTPLLILHGTEDKRVNPGQSMEMYRHLKLRGQAPVRLIFYPGEGHGNRNAAARLDYNLRTLRWLQHYLLGPGGEMPDRDLNYDEEPGTPAAMLDGPTGVGDGVAGDL